MEIAIPVAHNRKSGVQGETLRITVASNESTCWTEQTMTGASVGSILESVSIKMVTIYDPSTLMPVHCVRITNVPILRNGWMKVGLQRVWSVLFPRASFLFFLFTISSYSVLMSYLFPRNLIKERLPSSSLPLSTSHYGESGMKQTEKPNKQTGIS